MAGNGDAELLAVMRSLADDLERRLVKAIAQLTPEDLTWRANEDSNSVANLVLHLRGNLRQRYHAGFGAAPDDRDRPAEFADHAVHDANGLIALLKDAFADLRATLEHATADDLDEVREIQGRRATLRDVSLRALAHAAEHTGQILYIAKARRGALHLE